MSTIDPNAFAEWIVAKAEKVGASVTNENLRVAREAVETAVARDGDDIHVTCTLAGAAGPVQIHERMTRTAVEVLFPKVAMSHALPPLIEPEAKRIEAPKGEIPLPEEPRDTPRTQRMAVVIAVGVLFVICAAALVSQLAKDHDHHPSEHEKREARH